MHEYKRPESILVVVYTVDGRVLLLERLRPVGFWQSVTGSMLWDETDPLVTARRELQEETGLSGVDPVDHRISQRFPIKPEWRARYQPGVTENLEHVFSLELPDCRPIILSPHEHHAHVWLPRMAAAERTASWTNRDAILRCVPVD